VSDENQDDKLVDDELVDDELVDEPRQAGSVWFTATTAATATGRSARTIRRKAEAGLIPGAEQDDDGAWRIPAAGLAAAGLLRSESSQQPAGQGGQARGQDGQDDELARLRWQVQELTLRLDLQTRLATERAMNLEHERRTVSMLVGSGLVARPNDDKRQNEQKERRRRWRRR
jgi:hypothetical protein